jgi:D-alanyl-D-alanine carboxypeptidase/D-alanyl-D-alanine-endopeptidase (penicillin-binding protein 4)
MSRPRLRTAARIASILALAAALLVGGYAATYEVRRQVSRPPARVVPPTPAAFRGAGAAPSQAPHGTTAPRPTPAGLRNALARVLSAPGLGSGLRARVVDVASGAVLYDRGPATPGAPASTAKLLTAVAVLAVRPATSRIATRVVTGPNGALVLVGGGDPTLTGAAPGKNGTYPDAARLSDLAAQIRDEHVRPRRIVVDDSLFSGPAVSPAWAPSDVPSDYAAPITAVLADGGRATPGSVLRSTEPDLAAGHELAARLGLPGLPVVRGRASPSARAVAQVSSAPIGTLVAQTLEASDNVLAECLARQVALAEHLPASFTGSAEAIRRVVRGLGVDPGPGMVDGSGLAARDRLTAATLTQVLRLAAGGADPRLHTVLAALPVAAWSGSLANRFRQRSSRAGAGVVRAKTGTLTGVSALAGTVHDRSGRLLAFALLADRAGSTPAAENALDAIAARLATCGCR